MRISFLQTTDWVDDVEFRWDLYLIGCPKSLFSESQPSLASSQLPKVLDKRSDMECRHSGVLFYYKLPPVSRTGSHYINTLETDPCALCTDQEAFVSGKLLKLHQEHIYVPSLLWQYWEELQMWGCWECSGMLLKPGQNSNQDLSCWTCPENTSISHGMGWWTVKIWTSKKANSTNTCSTGVPFSITTRASTYRPCGVREVYKNIPQSLLELSQRLYVS
jgi:hypothetical protein